MNISKNHNPEYSYCQTCATFPNNCLPFDCACLHFERKSTCTKYMCVYKYSYYNSVLDTHIWTAILSNTIPLCHRHFNPVERVVSLISNEATDSTHLSVVSCGELCISYCASCFRVYASSIWSYYGAGSRDLWWTGGNSLSHRNIAISWNLQAFIHVYTHKLASNIILYSSLWEHYYLQPQLVSTCIHV